jgi:hypothetical protein
MLAILAILACGSLLPLSKETSSRFHSDLSLFLFTASLRYSGLAAANESRAVVVWCMRPARTYALVASHDGVQPIDISSGNNCGMEFGSIGGGERGSNSGKEFMMEVLVDCLLIGEG